MTKKQKPTAYRVVDDTSVRVSTNPESEDYETWLTGEVEDAARLIRPAPDGSSVMEPTTIGRAAAPKPPPKKPDQMTLF